MTKDQFETYLQKRTQLLMKSIVYPVLVLAIIGVGGAIYTYFGQIKSNKSRITTLENTKMEKEDFNKYLKIQAELNILLKERQEILTKRVDALEDEQKRLNQIDVAIAILEEKMKGLLERFGLKTRGGDEIIMNLDWFYQEIDKS